MEEAKISHTRRYGRLSVIAGVILITVLAVALGVYVILDMKADNSADTVNESPDSALIELNKVYEREAQLVSQLESLKTELESSKEEIEQLKAEFDRLEVELRSIEARITEMTAGIDPFAAVTELLSYPPVSGANVALYYEDIESGMSYSFSGDKVFYGASLVKLPFALELLTRFETMEDDGLDDVFTYTEECWQYGSGTIVESAPGTTFTYHELLIRLLRDSDNVAFEELMKKYGRSLVKDFAEKEGLEALFGNNWSMTAFECAKILRKTCEYISGEYKYSSEIKETMLGSGHRVMLCASGKPVAHKYGWDELAYHDIGIVYGTDSAENERPYYLAILTDMGSGSNDAEVNRYIQTIVRIIDKIHTALWIIPKS